ncbi:alkaline phosphatase family protein [Anaerolineales bacterium HSG6]|nr:alkaline phosphatase family protein [Anaerolineales bacterium HSG6]
MINPTFIKPRYNSHCFADLPATIKHLLTGQGQSALDNQIFGDYLRQYDTVILLFVDAFGWRFFNQYRDHVPLLTQLSQHGKVAKLTSQFPSTTAAHVTCIHTGLNNGQSGVHEWYYYEPLVDAVIAPLLFSFAGDHERETLAPTRIDPKLLYPTQTIYHDLAVHGVDSYIVQPRAFTGSTYSTIVSAGGQMVPYRTIPEAFVNLRSLLGELTTPSYISCYFDCIDGIGHHYGPNSIQLEAEVEIFFHTMQRQFIEPLAGQLDNALLLITADHGQVEVDPATTIYLNRDPNFAGVERFLKHDRFGKPLVPAGSSRDMFLYIKNGLLDEAQAFLASRLQGRAEVYQTEMLIQAGFFGPLPVSNRLLERVGNLVILPFAHESVWWYEYGRFEHIFYGHHGGLTPQEMEIPLLLWSF